MVEIPKRVLLELPVPTKGTGSGTYVEEVGKAFQELGSEVRILVAGPVQEVPGLDIRTVGYEDGKFPVFTTHPLNPQGYNQKFGDMNSEQVREYVGKWSDGLGNTIDEFQPELIHVGHAWVNAGITSHVLDRKGIRDVPLVATVHGTDIHQGFEAAPEAEITKIARSGIPRLKAATAISSSIQQEAGTILGLPKEKLPVSPNGFNPGVFQPNPDARRDEVLRELNLPEDLADKRLVITGGKFAEFKRHDRTIEAMAIASQQMSDLHLIHYGGGDEKKRDELLELTHNLGISERVHFVGMQPQKNVARLNHIGDVAIYASDNEPFGLVALESMGSGLPPVATNRGGFRDFINNRVGRLVEPTPEACANGILEEITGNAKQVKGPRAVEHARQFTWQRHIQPMLQIFDQNKKR